MLDENAYKYLTRTEPILKDKIYAYFKRKVSVIK